MKDQIKKTFRKFFEDKKTSLQTKALRRANDLTKPRSRNTSRLGGLGKICQRERSKGRLNIC